MKKPIDHSSSEAPNIQVDSYVQPHTLPIHLPTPGSAPSWPFQKIGQWRIDINQHAETWRQGMKVWRAEHLKRLAYDDSEYRRPELLWSQSNYVHAQMMVEDRYFYDPEKGEYTVDKYLDDLEERFGGLDSVLLWYIYPNIGLDDRNQIDLASDLPGGIEGLKKVVKDFQRRGVKVFLPTMPWDNGTRDSGVEDHMEITKLAADVGADGINGDTYYSVPRGFRDASDATGHPVVLQPETWPISDDAIMWNNQTWGKASTSFIPAVSKLKWLEPRHLTNVENRWARDRTDDFHYIFFNGHGYNAWENIWGIWNQFTPRAGETLRRISTIFRHFNPLLISPDWEPYFPTFDRGVFASKFPGEGRCLWTIVNRNEYTVPGDQIAIDYHENASYFDVWNGTQLHPRIENDQAIISLDMEKRGFGAILRLDNQEDAGIEKFLKTIAQISQKPLQAYSNIWKSISQRLVDIKSTPELGNAPEGMVHIPSGSYDFQVNGIEIEGYLWDGVDVQYPWEDTPRRFHRKHMDMKAFCIDQFPVTHANFQVFLQASGYHPEDDHNFLLDWVDGKPQLGWENRPVTWVSLEDARAYARWAGKRLPHEWEWQYAAQGNDGRLFPWGNSWDDKAVPQINTSRAHLPLANVNAHPTGASPFGVMDLVGNVWQWTDEYEDEHTRTAILRGGCSYQPQTSHWYFPQAYRLDQHGKYLLMAPCKDRAGLLGFRCAMDMKSE